MKTRVGFLGPAGTFSEEALFASASPEAIEPVALATIYEVAVALRRGEIDWGIVPIENSLDGSVTVTLDLLAETDSDSAHSRYNALVRRLVSFENTAECVGL